MEKAFNIRVVANAKKDSLKDEGCRLKVYITAPAVDGKANKALVDFLSKHFQVRKNQIEIIKGELSRDKVVKIVS